jgi:hypothetical protein
MTSNVARITERYVTVGTTVVLLKDIAAIQAISNGRGRPGLGVVLRLPRGLQVEVCGSGFSDQTVKVRTNKDSFFVLRRNVTG